MHSHLFDVRKGEGARVGLMFSLLSLIIATSYVLKPIRSSLFLNQFGAEQLPYVYLLVAVVLGIVATGFGRLVARMSLRRLFAKASLFFAINLIGFWLLVGAGWRWTGFAFYIWVSVFTAVMPSLYWLLANYVFFPNEGRRLFPILTAGGLFGSILGAAATWTLVPLIGTRFLMLTAALSLAGVAWLAARVLRQEQSRIRQQQDTLRQQRESRAGRAGSGGVLKLVSKSRHLRMLAALILVTSVTSTLVDYQFNLVVEQSFADLDGLTRFFGTFFGLINILAFLLELTLAGRIMKGLGLAGGLMILPIALGASSVGFLVAPSLLTAAAIKTADDGLSNSLNKSSVELLFLPLSLQIKNRVKSWLDMFVERFGRGIGGLVILAATALSWNDRLGLAVIALLVPWIALAFALQRQYGITFRDSIARREISQSSIRLQDTQSLAVLGGILETDDPRQQLHGLELIHETSDPALVARVMTLITSENALVRREALLLLGRGENPPVVTGLDAVIADPDPEVASAALLLRLGSEPERGRADFEHMVSGERTMTLVRLMEQMQETPQWLAETLSNDRLTIYAESTSSIDRRLAVLVGARLATSPSYERFASVIRHLMSDESIDVARTAIVAFSRLPPPQDFFPLVATLSRPSLRAPAAKALARFDKPAIDVLIATMFDPTQSTALRIGAIRALASFDQPDIPREILLRLPMGLPAIHYQAIKTLSKLRNRFDVKVPVAEVERLLAHEREQIETFDRIRDALASRQSTESESSGTSLLVTAIDERIETGKEKVFRLLGLCYPAEDLFNVWNRIEYGRPTVRAAAIEYLSTLLKGHHRRLVALVDDDERRSRSHATGDRRNEAGHALDELLRHTDPWLATCAAHVAGEWRARTSVARLLELAQSPELMLRESASHALDKIDRAQSK